MDNQEELLNCFYYDGHVFKKLFDKVKARLENIDLSHIPEEEWAGVNLRKANLKGTGIKFDPQTIKDKDLYETNLEGVDLSYIPEEQWIDVNLGAANLKGTSIKFNPQTILDKDLFGTNLEGIDLSHMPQEQWTDVDLRYTKLKGTGIKFNPQTIFDKDLYSTILENVDLSFIEKEGWTGVNLSEANLKGTNIKFDPQTIFGKNLDNTNLEKIDLSHIPEEEWIDVYLRGANLKGTGIKFDPQTIRDKDLYGTNLEDIDLSYVPKEKWSGVDLMGLNLKGTGIKFDPQTILNKNLQGINLEGVDLNYIPEEKWSGVDLREANLKGTGVKLSNDVCISDETQLPPEYDKWKLENNVPNQIKTMWYYRTLSLYVTLEHPEYFINKELAFSLSKGQLDVLSTFSNSYLLNNKENIAKCEGNDLLDKVLVWYKEKGYVPNHIIVKNVPVDQIKNFSKKKWFTLLSYFDKEKRDDNLITSMIKAAIVFGLFENDDIKTNHGYNKLISFLNYVPLYMPSNIKHLSNYNVFLKYYSKINVSSYSLVNGVDIPDEFYEYLNEWIDEKTYQMIKNSHNHPLRLWVYDHYYKSNNSMYVLNDMIDYNDLLKIKHLISQITYSTFKSSTVLSYGMMENMFSPLKSEFDEKFYHFLCDNFITILHNPKYYGQLSNIQHEYKRILRKFGREVNIIDCIRYLKEVEYFGMKDGNEELAFLCKMCGLPQKTFYDYQEIYETTKKRKESSIPYVEITNIGGLVTAKMLRLDDPLQLVIGETNLSNCCQKMYGLGESCMLHSTTSSNGRVFTTYDEVGNLLTQSWVWRNGDIICFDNIEASDYFKNHRQKYEHLVIDAYKKVSAELISIDNHLIDEILKKNNSEEINDFANIQKLRAVTVGDVGDHNDIVIDNCFKEICDRRRLPEEQVSYICESDIQRVIFINGETLVDPSSDYKNEAVFRDPRELKKEQGHNITEKTINKIIRIEKEGHLPNMKMHSDVQNANDLASTYGTNVDNLNVIIGEDWYYIYNNNEHDIYVGDLCRTKPRFKDEEGAAQKEIRAAFYQILDDSISSDEIKIISVDLREDTSYLLYLWLLKDGIVEQMGEDTRYIFDAPYDEEYITKNHQQEYLRNIKQIRDKKDDEEVYMHKLSFRPSNKYIEKFHPELMNMCMSR